MIHNQKGFTLIETLLTLSIILMLLTLPTITVKNALLEIQVELFLEQMQSNLRTVQNLAIFGTEDTCFQVLKDEREIRYSDLGTKDNYQSIVFPQNLTLDKTIQLKFKAGTGYSNLAKTIQFRSLSYIYRFSFQLGSGRYHYEKIKQ